MKKKGLLAFLIVFLGVGGAAATYYLMFKGQADDQFCKTNVYNPDLFGVGEPITLRHVLENLDLNRSIESVRMFDVKMLREWTWMGAFLINETVLNQTFKETLDLVISEMAANNIAVMGMAHDFPDWMTSIEGDSQAVPYRNMTEGSDYVKFLEKYKESWKTLARAFPNITLWEIGNEFNTDIFSRLPAGTPISPMRNQQSPTRCPLN